MQRGTEWIFLFTVITMVRKGNMRPTSNKYEKKQEIYNACMLEGQEVAM